MFYAFFKGMRDIIRYRCDSEKYLLSGLCRASSWCFNHRLQGNLGGDDMLQALLPFT